MIQIRNILPIWGKLALCLSFMAAMGGLTYSSGDAIGLVLIKTLVSGFYVFVSLGLGRSSKGVSKSDAESWFGYLVYRILESLAFPIWFTVFVWKPGLPFEESLKTFGIFFAIILSVMLLMVLVGRNRSTE